MKNGACEIYNENFQPTADVLTTGNKQRGVVSAQSFGFPKQLAFDFILTFMVFNSVPLGKQPFHPPDFLTVPSAKIRVKCSVS